MKRYRLSPEAEQDLNDIKTYYLSGAGVRVARYVTGEITRGFEFLAGTPGAGHKREDLTGEPVKFWQVFSYLIIYDPATKPLASPVCCTQARTSKPCFGSTRHAHDGRWHLSRPL